MPQRLIIKSNRFHLALVANAVQDIVGRNMTPAEIIEMCRQYRAGHQTPEAIVEQIGLTPSVLPTKT